MINHGLIIYPSFVTKRLEYILSNLTFRSKYACYAIQNITIGITDDPVETMQNFVIVWLKLTVLSSIKHLKKVDFMSLFGTIVSLFCL
jgi:hypothetical protein